MNNWRRKGSILKQEYYIVALFEVTEGKLNVQQQEKEKENDLEYFLKILLQRAFLKLFNLIFLKNIL